MQKINDFWIKNMCVEGKNTDIKNAKNGFGKVGTLITVPKAKVIKLAKMYKVHYQVREASKLKIRNRNGKYSWSGAKVKVKNFTYNKKTKKWKEKDFSKKATCNIYVKDNKSDEYKLFKTTKKDSEKIGSRFVKVEVNLFV